MALQEEESHPEEFETGQLPPRKRSRTGRESSHYPASYENQPLQTPTKPRRGRPPGSGSKQKKLLDGLSPASENNVPARPNGNPITPSKSGVASTREAEMPLNIHPDRSARRKSTRNLLDRATTADVEADWDLDEEENLLAKQIWEEDEISSEHRDSDPEEGGRASAAATPSKRKLGRPRKKSVSPPRNLPPHEQYFWQNRSGRVKTSDNTLSSHFLLNHEQHLERMKAYRDSHVSHHQNLHSLHERSFPQWRFELYESFNICLYGYGSKRFLVEEFASYLYRCSAPSPNILIGNGYNAKFNLSTLLSNLALLVYDVSSSNLLPKLPAQPTDLLSHLLAQLDAEPPSNTPINIFLNSLDSAQLRRGTIPSLIARLASHDHIRLLATCDIPNFPLLWDIATRDAYNFVFHDATTFISYAGPNTLRQAKQSDSRSGTYDDEAEQYGGNAGDPEIPSVVDSVNELLNRSGRTIKGKEGVAFVLRSLPENARSLYRILIAEIITIIDSGGGGDGDDDDEITDMPTTAGSYLASHDHNALDEDITQEAKATDTSSTDPFRATTLNNRPVQPNQSSGRAAAAVAGTGTGVGIPVHMLYQKTVEEFVCSNEMGFRQLLKEFWDHDMLVSLSSSSSSTLGASGGGRAGGGGGGGGGIAGVGAEILGVPFRREEMEAILEDLV